MNNDKQKRQMEEDPVYRRSLREAIVALIALVVVCVVCSILGYWMGYGLDASDVKTWRGIPVWVIWAVLIPWMGAVVFSAWFGLWYIQDQNLDEDGKESMDDFE